MRVVITGAGGFLGAHFTNVFIELGWEVVGVARRKSGLKRPGYEELQIDLTDPESESFLINSLNKSDYFCMLAAVKPNSKLTGREVLDVNKRIDDLSSRAFAASDCSNVLYLSGLSIFPNNPDFNVDEDSTPSPPDDYTMSRLAGEEMTGKAASDSGKNWKVLRINAPYGPGMPEYAVVHRFLTQAKAGNPLKVFDGGRREQHFSWAEDCARAAGLLYAGNSGLYHFVGPDRLNMIDLARLCIEIAGSASDITYEDNETGESCAGFNNDRMELLWPRADRMGINNGLRLFLENLTNRDSRAD